MDIAITEDLDMLVTENGDIKLTSSQTTAEELVQTIKRHILWIHDEWRLGPDLGFPWFEDVLVKNPNMEMITQLIRNEILAVDGVTSCDVEFLSFNSENRHAKFEFYVTASGGVTAREEVEFNG